MDTDPTEPILPLQVPEQANNVEPNEGQGHQPMSSEGIPLSQPADVICNLCGPDSLVDASKFVRFDGNGIFCDEFRSVFSSRGILEGSGSCNNVRGQYYHKCCNLVQSSSNGGNQTISHGSASHWSDGAQSAARTSPEQESPAEKIDPWTVWVSQTASATKVSTWACYFSSAVGLAFLYGEPHLHIA